MDSQSIQSATKDFSIIVNQNALWQVDKFHFHDTYEILLSLTNGGEIFVGEASYPLTYGGLLIFNNMDLHRGSFTSANCERYVVHFYPEYASMLSTDKTRLLRCFEHDIGSYNGSVQMTSAQTTELLGYIKAAQESENVSGYGADLRRRMTFMNLLLYVNSLYEHISAPSASAQKDTFQKIQPILQYVQQNYQNAITLDIISQTFFMSKYYLCHIFKEITGFGLNEYIINLRILKARELLRQNISVQEVGEIVGFANNSHFIRTFKSMVGTSPGQYSHKYR